MDYLPPMLGKILQDTTNNIIDWGCWETDGRWFCIWYDKDGKLKYRFRLEENE